MQPATAYTIITAEETEDLCTQVNSKLSEGWALHGHPFPHGRHLLQAMTCSGVGGNLPMTAELSPDKRLRKTSEDG